MNANILLNSLIHSSANACLQRYLLTNNITLAQDLKEQNQSSYGTDMSIVMFWGTLGLMTLKIHFNIEDAIRLMSKIQKLPLAEIDPKLARNFINELSNVQAGYLKGFLEKTSIFTHTSLPFLADGNDEVIFREIRDLRVDFDITKISVEGMILTFTSEVCLLEPDLVLHKTEEFERETRANLLVQNLKQIGKVNFL
jgi:CheY-specific phosphatase CheX